MGDGVLFVGGRTEGSNEGPLRGEGDLTCSGWICTLVDCLVPVGEAGGRSLAGESSVFIGGDLIQGPGGVVAVAERVPYRGGGCVGPCDNSFFIICFFHISGKFMNFRIVLLFFLDLPALTPGSQSGSLFLFLVDLLLDEGGLGVTGGRGG